MNKKVLLLFLAAFFLSIGFLPAEAQRTTTLAIGKGEAIVTFLEGPAEVLENGAAAWKPAKIRETLGEGDAVHTGNGARMELLLPDKSRARFAENSTFKIVRMELGGPSKSRDVKIHITLGKVWSNVAQSVGVKGNFSLSCDQAVTGVRGTIYRMNVEADHSALVRVYDGSVYVSGGGKTPEKPEQVGAPTRVEGPKPIPGPHRVTLEEWTVIINAMQQVMIGADGRAQTPRDFTEEEDRDEWVDWNRLRDQSK